MKKAVVTICCGSFFERLAAITHPTLEAYARRLGADFIVWRDFAGHSLPHYQKLELGKLLARYDRVLYLDTDILVRDDTPDLFELVPAGELGMLPESDYVDRKINIIQYMIAVEYDARAWDGKYYNAGVMVLSPCHANLFVQPERETNHFKEQTHLNVMISRTKTKVFPLPYRFNRMYYMDWSFGEHRCDCYLIHYAGTSAIAGEEEILAMAAGDRATWEREKPGYRFAKHVAMVVQGGLGDQVAAEPAIRYARDELYKHDRLAIVTGCSSLFAHLGLPIYGALEQVPNVNRYLPCYNLTNPARPSLPIDRDRVHPVDFASLGMLGIELPTAHRRPILPVDPQALASVRRKAAPLAISDLVVVHPGPPGEAKGEQPVDWTGIVQALLQSGRPPAVIGSRGAQPLVVVECDASGCVDLIDKLSVEELIALLSEARAFVAGDSAAVQIAGAFDAWIALVGARRHPDYVLPWRNGSQNWRAAAVEPEAIVSFVESALGEPQA
jgi:hypothetical protein